MPAIGKMFNYCTLHLAPCLRSRGEYGEERNPGRMRPSNFVHLNALMINIKMILNLSELRITQNTKNGRWHRYVLNGALLL